MRSAEEVNTIRTTRRDAAAAGPIPEQTMPWPVPGDRSQGHLPASGRRAVPTREYQCGGQPIHADPARRATPGAARPPPDPGTHRQRQPAPPSISPATALPARRRSPGLKPCHRPGRTIALTSRSISVCWIRSGLRQASSLARAVPGEGSALGDSSPGRDLRLLLIQRIAGKFDRPRIGGACGTAGL